MSERNLVYEALVLRARESPGGTRILTLMTAESGLVDVFVFGGPKSRLRSLACPYASGRAFVYSDPVKDLQKLSDFDVREAFPALREDLWRLWAAGFVAELLIRTSGGGGDFPLVYGLAIDCLGAIDRSGTPDSEGPLLIFIWRLLGLLGLGPDPTSCSHCGTELRPSRGGIYSFALECFLCPDCAAGLGDERGELRALSLGTGVLRWLSRCLELPVAEASRLVLLPDTVATLKSLLFWLARQAAEGSLASLDSAAIVSGGRDG